jgi:hypothetical protein
VGQSNPPVGQQQHKGHSYHGQCVVHNILPFS